MGKVLDMFDKYVDGLACCMLEGEEGVGCLRDCPYSRNGSETPTCKKELQNDEDTLRHVIMVLEDLLEACNDS